MIDWIKNKLSLNSVIDKYHTISTDTVFTVKETGAGYYVTFQRAYVKEHKETGERKVKYYSASKSEYFTEAQWNLATREYDKNDFSYVFYKGKHDAAFPKDEYDEVMTDD